MTSAVMMKAYDMANNAIISVSVATKATFPVGMMKSYDQYNVYFGTKVNTVFDPAFATTVATDMTCNTAVPVITKLLFAYYDEVLFAVADTVTSTTSSPDKDSLATTIISLIITPLHIIDHVSVVYLILLL